MDFANTSYGTDPVSPDSRHVTAKTLRCSHSLRKLTADQDLHDLQSSGPRLTSAQLRRGSAKHTTHWSATLAIRPSCSEKLIQASPSLRCGSCFRATRRATSHVSHVRASLPDATPQPLKDLSRRRPLTAATIALAARRLIPAKPEASQPLAPCVPAQISRL